MKIWLYIFFKFFEPGIKLQFIQLVNIFIFKGEILNCELLYNHEKCGQQLNTILMDNSFKVIDYIKYLYTFHAIAIDLVSEYLLLVNLVSLYLFYFSSIISFVVSIKNLTCRSRIYVCKCIIFCSKKDLR